MKRTRSTASSIHVCPYEECGKSFRSIRALTTHKKSHEADAPLQCTQKKCSRTFAVDSDRQAHIRQAHSPNVASRTRKRRQASAVQLVEGSAAADSAAELPSGRKSERKASDANVSPTNKGSNAEDEENSDKEIDASQSLVTEADEIVENAEYLASQMKVARSYDIAKWTRNDFQNAHQWAVWVQDNTDDFPDEQLLKKKISEKGLSMTMLRNAERAFFDSVLAYEALDADIFAHLLAAAKKRSEDIEEDVKDETKNGGAAAVRKHSREGMDSLSDAITQAILRKRRLKMLHGVRSELLEAVKYCEEEERKEAAIAARHGVDDVRAKGKLLLKSHLRMKTGELEDSLRKIDTATTETVEIICWEYITAYDEKESVRSTIGEFLQSIAGEFEKIWNGVSHRVIEEICQRDVRFFDAYLTALLKAAEGNAVGNSEGEEENVEDNSGTQDIKRRRIETVSKVQEEAKRRVLSLGDRCGYVFTNIDLDLEVSALEF